MIPGELRCHKQEKSTEAIYCFPEEPEDILFLGDVAFHEKHFGGVFAELLGLLELICSPGKQRYGPACLRESYG